MAKRIMELANKRTETSRHYLLDNGSIEAEIFSHAVNYKDKAGKFQPINTAIQAKAQAFKRSGKADIALAFAVEKAPYKWMAAEKSDGYHVFEVGEAHAARILWRLKKAINSPASISANRIGSMIKYIKPFPMVDVNYYSLPDGIKEELILTNKNAPKNYTFEIIPENNTTLTENPDSSITAEGIEGEHSFIIQAPFVEDAAGVRGPLVSTLTKAGEAYELTLAVDEAWLKASDRAYPVVIDPTTATIQPSSADAYVLEQDIYVNSNYGSTVDLFMCSHAGYCGHGLIKFDLSSIPAGQTINSADLSLYHNWNNNSVTLDYYVQRITADWAEGTVTWNNKPANDGATSTTMQTSQATFGTWRTVSITALVAAWKAGTYSNYGVYLNAYQGSSSQFYWAGFCSNNYASDTSLRPKLVVNYGTVPTAPTALSPDSNEIFDAGDTKRFSWTHNDPEGDAQVSYQAIFYRVADGATILDTGEVATSTQYRDVTAATFVNGVAYQWKVRTKDTYGGWGPYSQLAAFKCGTPPTVAITSPSAITDYTQGIVTVEWDYSDPESQAQSKYQAKLYTASKSSLLESSGEVSGTDGTYTFATLLENNTAYVVEVTAWDTYGQSDTDEVAFATDFIEPATPTLAITEQASQGRIKLEITNPAWDADGRYEQDDTAVVYAGTWETASGSSLSGNSAEYSAMTSSTAIFTFNGTAVTWISRKSVSAGIAKVYIDDVYQQDVDLYSLEVLNQEAVYTKTGLSASEHTIKVEVAGTKNASASGYNVYVDAFDIPVVAELLYNNLYRRISPAAWERIATELAVNATYYDYAVASDIDYDYKVVAVAVTYGTAASTIQLAEITLTGVWLHDTEDPELTALKILALADSQPKEMFEHDVRFLKPAGRQYPVAVFGDAKEYTFSIVSALFSSNTDFETLKTLYNREATLCVRDKRGKKIFCVLTRLPVEELFYGVTVDLNFIQVDFDEEV